MAVALQIASESDRFRAAIVAMGIANFSSQYGATSLSMRLHADRPSLGAPSRYEDLASSNYMGRAPWIDPRRYEDNSPLAAVSGIKAPILLIHSDFDYFSLSQSEELFVALSRMRRKVEYVTYWGEGHVPMSPANIRDMWRRIYSWLDDNLRSPAMKAE